MPKNLLFGRIGELVKKRILVIDDDAMNLRMAEYILLQHDYEVIKANSGEAGIALLKSDSFDLLLLDIEMPGMSGIETLEQIRKDPGIADIRVMFLTASNVKTDLSDAIRLGALDFVRKPFFPEDLLGRIEKTLAVERKDIILVVDDDRMNLMLAKKILGVRCQVETVSSGREALDFLMKQIPDLILLDLHMPEMSGIEVMERLQKDEKCQDIPVIFLTADVEKETEIEMFRAGASDFIAKPFTAEVVIQRVARMLEMSHLQKSLKDEVERKTAELRESNRKNKNLSVQIMMALSSAIDAKDRYTNGHSTRVAKYSREIARRIGKSQEEMDNIYFAALLHDVGKIGVPDAIINKNGPLDDEEYAIIKSHPCIGAQILQNVSELSDIAVGANWHHERYDGKGYPDGLSATDIPEVARIIGVADAYDAMSSIRSYRDVLPQEVVRSEIEKGRGTQFDPIFADIFLQMIEEDTAYNMREKKNL